MVKTVMSAMVTALVAANEDAAALLQHQSGILGDAATDKTFERQEDQKVLKGDLGLDTISNDTVVAAIGDGGCTPPDEMEVAKFIMYEIEAFMGTPDFCWRQLRGRKCWKKSTKGIARPGGKMFYACLEHHPCPTHTSYVSGLFPGCRQNCVGAQSYTCGVGACSSTGGDCARGIISMTVAVASAIKSSLLMAFPGGVLVQKVQMSAQQASALHKGAKTGFPFALSKMKHVLTSQSAQNVIIQKAKQKMVKYIKGDLECDVAKAMMKQTIAAVGKAMVSKEPDDMDKFNFGTFDSDGMAQAIKEEKVSKAKTWLNTAGAVDPSGWLSAAATFVKPTCDDYGSWEDYEKLPEIKVSPTRRRAPPCVNGCTVQKKRGKCPSSIYKC